MLPPRNVTTGKVLGIMAWKGASPVDFHDFWNGTRAALKPHRVAFQRSPGALDRLRPDLRLDRLFFLSLGGAGIHAYLLRWADTIKRPLVVHAHGYDCDGCRERWEWAQAGVHVLGVDLRGYGRSGSALPGPFPWGRIFSGEGGPKGSFLRGAVSDFFLAAIVGREVMHRQVSRMVFYGAGFSAPLALMAEGLGQLADLIVLRPTDALRAGRAGIPIEPSLVREVRAYWRGRPDRRSQLRALCGYFDPSQFAPLVQCPVLLGAPESRVELIEMVRSRLGGPCRIIRLRHGDDRREFAAEWLATAVEGPTAGFETSQV